MKSKKYISIFMAIILIFQSNNIFAENKLQSLEKYYGKTKIFSGIFENGTNIENYGKTINYTVNPYVEPQMGWKTNGNAAQNPTKVAADGLNFAISGEIEKAKKHATWLIDNSVEYKDSLFFPFKFDFQPYWPFKLEAPWNSGLTQGLSLALFSYLYKYTGEDIYIKYADKIYNSFKIDVLDGGVTRIENGKYFIEEYPTLIPTRVLNGSAVAVLAIKDYSLIAKNKEAEEFFYKLIDRLEELIGDYDLKLEGYDFTMSSYSLAPYRNEILMRFTGGDSCFISKIQVMGYISNKEYKIAEQNLGKGDDDVENSIIIWPDSKYMNWSTPQINNNLEGRFINQLKGEYNHSPFKVALPADFKKYEKIAIEVEYKYKQDSLNKVYLSMYNEIEYVNLGILDSNEGTNKQTFYIPKEELQKWSREKKEYSLPDVRYLDDNQTLIELLASESSSKKLKAYAKKWEKANELVPNEYLNNKQVDFKKNIEELYEIHGSDNDLSMDISIINGKEKFYISKNQYGDRNIHLYSELNGKLMDNGLIFNKNFEVGKNKISPSLVESKDNKYKLYFILENDVKQKTGDIYLSESEDGINWRNPKLFKQGSYCNISDYSYDENSYLFVTKKVGNATQLERINLKTLEYEHIYTTHSNVDGVIKETMGFNNDGVDYLMIKLVSERGGRYKFFDIASNEILNFEKGVYIDNPYINNGIIKTDFEHKFKNSKLYYISMQDNNGKSKAYISKADLGDLLLEQFPIKIATKSNINKKKNIFLTLAG